MLANSDQWVDIDIDDYLASMDRQRADGLIMTMKADDPKWSFVGLDRPAAGHARRREGSDLERGDRRHLQLPPRIAISCARPSR